MVWTQIILLLDLSYTAFLVPILVGFEVSDVDWGYGAALNSRYTLPDTVPVPCYILSCPPCPSCSSPVCILRTQSAEILPNYAINSCDAILPLLMGMHAAWQYR